MKPWRDTGEAMTERMRERRRADCLRFRIEYGLEWQSASSVGLALGGRYPKPNA